MKVISSKNQRVFVRALWVARNFSREISQILRSFFRQAHFDCATFTVAAFSSIVALAAITLFVLSSVVKIVREVGVVRFVFGAKWQPDADLFGVLPMFVGSLAVTAAALLIALPLGTLAGIFSARFCPAPLRKPMTTLVDLAGSIPSVIYGFVALQTVVPFVADVFGGSGASLFAAATVLAVMVTPSMVSLTRAAFESLDSSLCEAALALGATHETAAFSVELRKIAPAIKAAARLSLTRALGETTAVVMVCGNQPIFPQSFAKGCRTLTANLALEMGYATGIHRTSLLGCAALLFILVFFVNIFSQKTR